MHSEFNHSKTEPVHFLQIWIVPDTRGLRPTYAQRAFDREAARRGFVLLASRDGRDGSVQVSQDVELRVTVLAPEERREVVVAGGRHAWIHVARGAVSLDGTPLAEGDGAQVSGPARVDLQGREHAEVLLFDLA